MGVSLKTITALFKFDDSLFFERIGSLEESTASKPVSGHANSILWIAGHLLNSRNHMLELLGKKVDLPWAPLFRAKSEAAKDYPKLSALKEAWAEISEHLFEKLDGLSEDDLAKKLDYELPHGDNTVGGAILFWAYHEAWHLGQIAYVRRCLGMEGLVPY